MKKLELQNFGVQELDANEMREVDGGNPIYEAAKTLVGWMWGELKKDPNAFTSPNAHTTPYGHMGGARP